MDWFGFGDSSAPKQNQEVPEENAAGVGTESETTTASEQEAPRAKSIWDMASSALDTIKQKSESVVEMYKHDLAEFVDTVQTDTKEAMVKLKQNEEDGEDGEDSKEKEGGSSTLETVYRSTSSLLSHIVGEGGSEGSDPSAAGAPTLKRMNSGYSRHEARLMTMRADKETYTRDPEDTERYTAWREGFDVSAKAEEMEAVLGKHPVVQSFHSELVPEVVAFSDFWLRYFYKQHVLDEEERRRSQFVKNTISGGDDESEEDLGWGSDNDDNDNDNDIDTPTSKAEAAAAASPHTDGRLVEPSESVSAVDGRDGAAVESPVMVAAPESGDGSACASASASDSSAECVKVEREDTTATAPITNTATTTTTTTVTTMS
eukprot:GFYU01009886.1.p1 GENE.GFYU01009886.1~~GFYU01009886.1.p1  ORF type:complete len:374 (-),score=91.34 GFYU01009886.1:114-1235(-)